MVWCLRGAPEVAINIHSIVFRTVNKSDQPKAWPIWYDPAEYITAFNQGRTLAFIQAYGWPHMFFSILPPEYTFWIPLVVFFKYRIRWSEKEEGSTEITFSRPKLAEVSKVRN